MVSSVQTCSSLTDRVAKELGLSEWQVSQALQLLDEGNTIPFITRYRKERTGNLDEERLREVQKRTSELRQLADRAETILRSIEGQGKLTNELRKSIGRAETLKRLEDLYLPYRPKRKTRATTARERGLEPLADQVWTGKIHGPSLALEAAKYLDPSKSLSENSDVLQGVSDILAERISEDADLRASLRKFLGSTGRVSVQHQRSSKQADEADSKHSKDLFRDFNYYSESLTKIPNHRILAINRGEKLDVLRVRIDWDRESALDLVHTRWGWHTHPNRTFLRDSALDSLDRLIHPSIEREARNELTERAQTQAIHVFARNLRSLFLQPPLLATKVLALDPGYRTGVKLAMLDEIGCCLETDVIFVAASSETRAQSRARIAQLMKLHDCKIIAIGNGTACRETEELVEETIRESLPEARYVIVNEAGASVYSASQIAREEFPQLDASLRGTISIGRRLQDPLSELVKIDPQHLGIGMYQHDLEVKVLQESLEAVVESCVNFIGVDLNTAGPALLCRVSGLNQSTARKTVEWREKHGRFRNRMQLLEVPGIGNATFTQAAGFLKIIGGDEPLDQTWIHPESYSVARKLISKYDLSGCNIAELSRMLEKETGNLNARTSSHSMEPSTISQLAQELVVGVETLRDILDSLARPGRDPRVELPGPLFRKGVLKPDDLVPGMELQGRVTNIVDFGAFVDIGLKDSGLVHISQMSTGYVRTPHDIVDIGDIVTVWVLQIDRERKRTSLSLIPPAQQTNSG